MKNRRWIRYAAISATAGTAFLLSACVSVPRDAGTKEVQQEMTRRGGPELTWRPQPSTEDAAEISALLEDELTADEAVAAAMINNPRLQVALAELGIARADLVSASTIANPLIELEVRFRAEPYHPFEVRLAQSLIDLIQLPRRRALGRTSFVAAQMEVSSTVLRFASDVRSAWVDAVAAEQQLKLSRTNAEAAQAAADVALRQHGAQNITDLDLENEQALYEQSRLDLSRADQRATLAREQLARLMGLRRADVSWQVSASFPPLPQAELGQQQLELLASGQRLDLSIAQAQLELARQQIPLARLAILQEVMVDYHYEREPDGTATQGPGLELPIPIFNTGRGIRARREAEFLRARHLAAAIEAESSSNIRIARTAVDAARARVEYYRDVVVPRRVRILELTGLEHNAMLVGIFQLLTARQNEVQARRDLIEAQREYWLARWSLDRAVQGIASATSFTPATDQRTGQSDDTRGRH